MPSKLRAVVRAIAFLSLTFFLIVTYPLAIAAGPAGRRLVRRVWCRTTCWILGLKVTCEGPPFASCPTLFVANHVSYLDVLAIGSFVDATFIAKSEVKAWPLIGFIASCSGTMFIKRHWRQALLQRNAIAARMRKGESFVLFAEGTSSNGLAVRPLKTSLMSVAEPWVLDCPVAAQSLTVAYTRLADGRAHDSTTCELYAWYDEMPFAPHLVASARRPWLHDRDPHPRACHVVVGGEPQTARPTLSRRTHGVTCGSARRCGRAGKPSPDGSRRCRLLARQILTADDEAQVGNKKKEARKPPLRSDLRVLGFRLVV